MGSDCLMPMADRPRTRPDGTAFTIDDKEYWLREKDGGIRRNDVAPMPYPKMLYRGLRGENGKPAYETRIVDSARQHEAEAAMGWVDHPAEAIEGFERHQEAIARAAAEAAYASQRMSETARAEYAQASIDDPEHVTDVAPKRKPGRPPKVSTAVE